jgi:hypothetical protein
LLYILSGRARGDHEKHSVFSDGAKPEGFQEDGVPLTGTRLLKLNAQRILTIFLTYFNHIFEGHR